jgi:hypothetical protein
MTEDGDPPGHPPAPTTSENEETNQATSWDGFTFPRHSIKDITPLYKRPFIIFSEAVESVKLTANPIALTYNKFALLIPPDPEPSTSSSNVSVDKECEVHTESLRPRRLPDRLQTNFQKPKNRLRWSCAMWKT